MKTFHFFSKYIAYTFSLAFLTALSGLLFIVSGLVFAFPFTAIPYDTLLTYVFKGAVPVLLILLLIYFTWYGFFSPVKIPAIKKTFREINQAYRHSRLMKVEFLERVYKNLCHLPFNNMVSSFLLIFSLGTICIGIVLFKLRIEHSMNADHVRQLTKFIGLSTVISAVYYGLYAFVFTDYVTRKERAFFYNLLSGHGKQVKPVSHFSVKMKTRLQYVILLISLAVLIGVILKFKPGEAYFWHIFFSYLGAVFLVIALFIRISGRAVSSVLKELAEFANTVWHKALDGDEVLIPSLSLDRELALIGHNLVTISREMAEHRANLEREVGSQKNELEHALSALEVKDHQIQKQLDMATLFQKSILPEDVNDWNELKITTRYIAMDQLGGDFFDIKAIRDNKIGIMIADVSGHGIQAALITAMAKMSFDNAIGISDSPKNIFKTVNKSILDNIKTQEYMTCFMVVIDDEYNVHYSNASHPKAIFVNKKGGEVEFLDTNGLFIGAAEDVQVSYEEKVTSMQYGDRLILYSDGIPQAINGNKEEYSLDRLQSVVKNKMKLPLENFADAVINDVKEYVGDAEYIDDLTVIVVELAYDEAVKIVRETKQLINAHKYEEAITLLKNGLKRYPANQKLLYNLAKCYFRIDDYNKAIETIKSYIQNDNKNKYAYYLGGASYYKVNDFKKAIEFYRQALSIDHNFTYALFALGMSYKKSENNDAAIKVFQRVIDLDPGNKMALYEIEKIRKAD